MRVSARLYKREGTEESYDIEPGECAACAFVARFVEPVVGGVSFVEHEGELFMVSQLFAEAVSMVSCEVVSLAEADAELERARLEMH